MSAGRAYKSAIDAFDFLEFSVVCRDCGHSDEHHTVRTWWSAPNRTAGWDAPTTSGSTYSAGSTLKGLSARRTRFGGESRCTACGSSMKWAIITERSRVVSISLSDPLEPLRLVGREHRSPSDRPERRR